MLIDINNTDNEMYKSGNSDTRKISFYLPFGNNGDSSGHDSLSESIMLI